ncbi:MAG: acetylglutamate kinase [Elusimicrobia bacterium]|nr:acetylglutamate kinase [Elusimicrobiota bacterium]
MKNKKLTVIKFGGSLTKNPKAQDKFLKELVVISKKEKIILVHGGGPEINALLNKLNITSKFINGLRHTCAAGLEAVEMALSAKVNKMITTKLLKYGASAVGISGKDGASVICKPVKDLGFVGEPVKINKHLIDTLLKGNFLPVVSSVCADAKMQGLNVNADSLASALAVAFKADKLIFLTDVAGVLNADKKTIPELQLSKINELIKQGVVTGGMIPKIQGCAESIKKGVKEVWIINGAEGIKKMKGTVIKK